MTLDLDDRQRAMLQEMHVPVWLPRPVVAAAVTDMAVRVEPVETQRLAVNDTKKTPTGAVRTETLVQRNSQAPAPAGDMPALDGMDWPALRETAAACQACGLCAGRKNTTLTVPATSTTQQADWLIVGDPPDEDEDRSGQPFALQAGQLLDNMLKAVDARRTPGKDGEAQTAFATDVVKCRPPQGRNPQPAELAQCAHFLQREIALLRPKVILAMGRFAIQSLLADQPELASQPLGKLRGTVYRYQGVPVVVTYHPKALLRASSDKAKAWADLCLAMDVVEA
jgi:uracil-DNA glycosylase